MNSEYIEYEHKFVVDDNFNVKQFTTAVLALKPSNYYSVSVRDDYYLPNNHPQYIYRHRSDRLLNQLTYKCLSNDSEKRVEINLDLQPETTSATVEQFIKTMGDFARISLTKEVTVFYFQDIEIVYYEARYKKRRINCVEFEIRNYQNDMQANAILQEFETKLGFTPQQRATKSLLELMTA